MHYLYLLVIHFDKWTTGILKVMYNFCASPAKSKIVLVDFEYHFQLIQVQGSLRTKQPAEQSLGVTTILIKSSVKLFV